MQYFILRCILNSLPFLCVHRLSDTGVQTHAHQLKKTNKMNFRSYERKNS
ncbi:hypothetical protein EMIT019CA3_370009 [Bacillus pseudomycoides]